MAQTKRIGIRYIYDENWIGGSYYIQNLIRSLHCLPEKEQIQLYILAADEQVFQELKAVTGYPQLKFVCSKVHYNKIETFINKVSKKILKRKLIFKKIDLDWLFPLYDVPDNLKHIRNLVFWIPDLQEKHLPDFFSPEDLQYRHDSYEKMIALNHPIVFSSHAALNDFHTFYPHSKNEKKVLQFAVVHSDLEVRDINEVKAKYGIEVDYFISPNQFWQHKNQIAIIEATKILKEKGISVKIIFTGKEHDHRNPEYTNLLKQKVSEYQLENEIVFLGFIDRTDQLTLMKYAQAVIQPSLFEGWGTVVEDAKSLNQTLIVSDIAVHHEQLEGKGYFFAPSDYNALALKMVEVINNPTQKLKYDLDYAENIKRFASNLKLLTAH
ncbi:glycosyltransferase family 1 protein [Flavobacterium sp. GT3R68]|uniref:glycosyltransferase family 4 protein n=1 Tax=Flavobacterium sp. GT3R68 TaxID=2594437 RepID=UPI000F89AF72|nr:glycosyltransferase family 1 protein [Flavobacterium sp. GT3R68]RTY92273.1 glycosyltransferase [Flavobacterium sp. GSN2]TRW92509.1 glycosyltransferase family 4 protein [Flavobacterium sp. GT3R68]